MKRNKWLALLLALVMVLGMVPMAEAEDIAPAAEETQSTENVAAVQASSTITSASQFPLTLTNGAVVQINGPIDYTAPTGKSPITVAAGASASLIINGSVTLHGANASGTTGATAAIKVPSGSTLYIYSAHDEELSTSTDAPKDTLTVYGGNAAAGATGENSVHTSTPYTVITGNYTAYRHKWTSGGGGAGGGGAAAAIGGNGGAGGAGGSKATSPVNPTTSNVTVTREGADNNAGVAGASGSAGSEGETAGSIYILGRLTLNATGGNAASGGAGGAGTEGLASITGNDMMIGGCGGGGGGGGGCAAPAIGAGGAGGSGGGAGGLLSSDCTNTVEGCGGGGGGGGWPNGGGGGGGGSECSDAYDDKDNTSTGGSGGFGGGVGGIGSSGSSGTATGVNKHGYNNGRYDAEPGSGGSGASGVQGAGGPGGSGGTEKDNQYNAGAGGAGGGSVAFSAWHTKGSLTLSTANNLNLNSSMGYAYNYGDGQGYGSSTYITPYIVYDLMDCSVNVNGTYTYTGAQIKPSCTVTYSASTDRDGSRVSHGSSINVTSYTAAYGENIHCPTGTVTLTGKANASRNTATSDGSVVGVRTQEFTIKQAKIKSVSITMRPETSDESPLPFDDDYRGKSNLAIIELGNYTSTAEHDTNKDIGEIKLKTPSTVPDADKAWQGWFIVSWAKSDNYTVSERWVEDRCYEFQSTRGGKFSPQIIMTNMNDFEDFTDTIPTITVDKSVIPLQQLTTPCHPRIPVSIQDLPSDVGNATYQWYLDGQKIEGATSPTYTPTNKDIGKRLSVNVIPDENSPYLQEDDTTASATVGNHSYSNGFCSVCGEYEKPSGSSTTGYTIKNGGQLFWFAAQVNGDSTHAEDVTEVIRTINGTLANDIDLQNPADTKAGKTTEWTPMGSTTGVGAAVEDQYSGTFNGNGHTISGMSITTSDARTGLFADAGTGAVIRNFTIEGNITLTRTNRITNATSGVGGVVGCMYMGDVTGVTSKVNISGAEGVELVHVGGVVGGTYDAGVNISRCVFEGSVSVYNSHDCIGGVVGYANSKTVIEYCANRGTVRANSMGASGQSPYVGGVLGYINNDTDTAVKNCYNYGSVSCVSNTYCGAVVGWARKIKTLDDCYYLSGSATTGIGNKASYVPMPPAMSKAQFASGEVCYLVNGKITLAKDGAVWMQDVDNGNEPYDQYPVFDADSVYYRSDHTYSNDPEKISVTVSWGSMAFTCTQEWDPDTHVNTVTWAPAEDKVSNAFTVKNDSNVKVNVTPTFQAVDAVLSGTVSGLTGSALDKGASETGILSLSSTSVPSSLTTSPGKIGTLTITVSALYQS